MIRCFVDFRKYKEKVMGLCENNPEIYADVTKYFLGEIEFVTGHRALQKLLEIRKDETEIIRKRKNIFLKFSRWFLKERALRYIIHGNMVDKISYIQYKNHIMLHYINRPEKWNSNAKKSGKAGKIY